MNEESSKKRDLEHVGDLIDVVVSALGARTGGGAAVALWSEWAAIAGADWADTVPVRLERGVLSVAVPDGRRATRLRYSTGELKQRIEARLGPEVVSSVRVHVRRPGKQR